MCLWAPVPGENGTGLSFGTASRTGRCPVPRARAHLTRTGTSAPHPVPSDAPRGRAQMVEWASDRP